MELVSQLKLAIVPRKMRERLLTTYTIYPTKYCQIEITCRRGVILETVLLRSHEVATLVLSDSDVPGPGGGGGGGVNIYIDRRT